MKKHLNLSGGGALAEIIAVAEKFLRHLGSREDRNGSPEGLNPNETFTGTDPRHEAILATGAKPGSPEYRRALTRLRLPTPVDCSRLPTDPRHLQITSRGVKPGTKEYREALIENSADTSQSHRRHGP